MALTDVAIRNAKPGAKATKLADGGGMFLLVTPAGGKLWRLKYRDEYCEKRIRDGAKGWAPATATRSEYLLSLVCGSMGKLPIGEIEPADVLTAIRRIEGRQAGKRPA